MTNSEMIMRIGLDEPRLYSFLAYLSGRLGHNDEFCDLFVEVYNEWRIYAARQGSH